MEGAPCTLLRRSPYRRICTRARHHLPASLQLARYFLARFSSTSPVPVALHSDNCRLLDYDRRRFCFVVGLGNDGGGGRSDRARICSTNNNKWDWYDWKMLEDRNVNRTNEAI